MFLPRLPLHPKSTSLQQLGREFRRDSNVIGGHGSLTFGHRLSLSSCSVKGCTNSSPDGCCKCLTANFNARKSISVKRIQLLSLSPFDFAGCPASDKVPTTKSIKVTSTFTKFKKTVTKTVTKTITSASVLPPGSPARLQNKKLRREEEETLFGSDSAVEALVNDEPLTSDESQASSHFIGLFARAACPACPKGAQFVTPDPKNKTLIYCCPGKKTVTKTKTVPTTITKLVKTKLVTKSMTKTVRVTASVGTCFARSFPSTFS